MRLLVIRDEMQNLNRKVLLNKETLLQITHKRTIVRCLYNISLCTANSLPLRHIKKSSLTLSNLPYVFAFSVSGLTSIDSENLSHLKYAL